MSTVRVGNYQVFTNFFTSRGRATNSLYRELYESRFNLLLERKLPDKSRVLLAYENPKSPSAKYAFKLNSDGTMVQKMSEKGEILGLFDDTISAITKIFTDKKGRKTKEVAKKIRYDANKKIKTKSVSTRTDKYFSEYNYNRYGASQIHHNKVYPNVEESFVKVATDGSNKDYTYIKNTDGTKIFIRNINGVNYTFTTAK